jgi:DNA-binding XRE family transcriptional regulator
MFSALVEFWIAARRAQTANLEARSKPGQYKASLPVIPEANTESPSPSPIEASMPTAGTSYAVPRAVHDALYADSQWRALMDRMPVEGSAPPPVIETPHSPDSLALNESAAEPTKEKKKRRFYREFIASPPAEVVTRIACGTYFTRAWRDYRGLSLDDTAELYGCDKTTIIWHESGKTAPKAETLKKLADIYDAPLDQFTPKPGSDDSPFVRAADTPRC